MLDVLLDFLRVALLAPTYDPEPATLQVVADVPLNDVKKPVGVWAEFHPSEPRLAVHTGGANAIQIYAWDPASLA